MTFELVYNRVLCRISCHTRAQLQATTNAQSPSRTFPGRDYFGTLSCKAREIRHACGASRDPLYMVIIGCASKRPTCPRALRLNTFDSLFPHLAIRFLITYLDTTCTPSVARSKSNLGQDPLYSHRYRRSAQVCLPTLVTPPSRSLRRQRSSPVGYSQFQLEVVS